MTTGTSAQAEAATVEKGTGTEDGTPTEPYLKTPTSVYMTPEEAAKGVAEKDKALQQAQNELARLKREQQQADALSKLSESIDKMSAGAGSVDRQKEHEEMLRRMQEEVAEDPGKLVPMAQGWIQSLDADYERKLKEREEALRNETASQLKQVQDELRQLSLASNPVYRDHADKVQETMDEFGVDQDTAIRFVSKMVESAGEEADQPLGTTGTRVNTQTAEKREGIDPSILAFLEQKNGPLSDEEKAAIAEKRSRG